MTFELDGEPCRFLPRLPLQVPATSGSRMSHVMIVENRGRDQEQDDEQDDTRVHVEPVIVMTTATMPWAWLKAAQDILNAANTDSSPPPAAAAAASASSSSEPVIAPMVDWVERSSRPVAVLPWLYLAPLHAVYGCTQHLHETLGITHVLSTNRLPPEVLESLYWSCRSHDMTYGSVGADDDIGYPMIDRHWSDDANGDTASNETTSCRAFLKACRFDTPKGKAVVHCTAGMNRSGCIVAAAMMELEGMDVLEVFRTLKRARGRVLTNPSFVEQLVMLAVRCGRLGDRPDGYTDEPIALSTAPVTS